MSFPDLPAARMNADCRLSASAVIEPDAIIHDRTTLGDGESGKRLALCNHVQVSSHSIIGVDCRLPPFADLSANPPQHES